MHAVPLLCGCVYMCVRLANRRIRICLHYVAMVAGAAGVFFVQTFEDGGNGWRGKTGSVPETAMVVSGSQCHGGSGSCMQFRGCSYAGDAFSVASVECTLKEPCDVSYWYKGSVVQGFSAAFPGHHTWTAVRKGYPGNIVEVDTTTSWTKVQYVFPQKAAHAESYIHGINEVNPSAIAKVHFMIEAPYGTDAKEPSNCSTGFVDDIRITQRGKCPPPLGSDVWLLCPLCPLLSAHGSVTHGFLIIGVACVFCSQAQERVRSPPQT